MNKIEQTKTLIENFRNFISESNEHMYFKTYSAAISSALEYSEKRGYETDKEEVAELVGIQSRRPKTGQTTTVHIPLYKNGKLQKKHLHIMVYGLENSYELTRYIL